ncbi:hypothetical protein KCP75_00150 [Salmonella enterica subsp. enterica]|nr:hypothetical protein KCP75_00150 [Salmonella enterica subsp. enterica]
MPTRSGRRSTAVCRMQRTAPGVAACRWAAWRTHMSPKPLMRFSPSCNAVISALQHAIARTPQPSRTPWKAESLRQRSSVCRLITVTVLAGSKLRDGNIDSAAAQACINRCRVLTNHPGDYRYRRHIFRLMHIAPAASDIATPKPSAWLTVTR